MHAWALPFAAYLALSSALVLLRRKLATSPQVSARTVATLSYAIGVIPIGIIVGLSIRHHIDWSAWTIFLLVLEGSLISVFTWLSIAAMKYIPAAHFQTVFQLHAVVVILLG